MAPAAATSSPITAPVTSRKAAETSAKAPARPRTEAPSKRATRRTRRSLSEGRRGGFMFAAKGCHFPGGGESQASSLGAGRKPRRPRPIPASLGIAVEGIPPIVGRTNTPLSPMDTPVSALIERKGSAVHSVASTITITDAVAEMNKHRIGSILVLDGGQIVDNGQLKGLISIGDISRWVADVSRAEADHLKNYISGGFSA